MRGLTRRLPASRLIRGRAPRAPDTISRKLRDTLACSFKVALRMLTRSLPLVSPFRLSGAQSPLHAPACQRCQPSRYRIGYQSVFRLALPRNSLAIMYPYFRELIQANAFWCTQSAGIHWRNRSPINLIPSASG